jgi:hypothetical protein
MPGNTAAISGNGDAARGAGDAALGGAAAAGALELGSLGAAAAAGRAGKLASSANNTDERAKHRAGAGVVAGRVIPAQAFREEAARRKPLRRSSGRARR